MIVRISHETGRAPMGVRVRVMVAGCSPSAAARRAIVRGRPAGRCMQPVLIRGRVYRIDGSTGELVHRYTTTREPGGLLPVHCKTRRASRCLPCAETYRYDTYQLIRAGLTGGKGVPASIAAHPAVFGTLTAPSFGRSATVSRLLRLRRIGPVQRLRPRAVAPVHHRPAAPSPGRPD
jgi:hypothetical protein